MIEDVYGELTKKLEDLAPAYSLRLDAGELEAYRVELARFPLAVALVALDAAPLIFPAVFPSLDEMVDLCERIASAAPRLVQDLALVAECEHEYRFEPEPEGGLYSGFDVCCKCGRAKPRVNEAPPPVQLEYFRMAVNPQGREN